MQPQTPKFLNLLDYTSNNLQRNEIKLTELANEAKVLDSSIDIKQKHFEKLRLASHEAERLHQEKLEVFKEELAAKKQVSAELDRTIKNKRKQLVVFQEDMAAAKKALATIEKDVAERKKYQNEQEKIIAQTIEEGNMSLKAIIYEIEDLVDKKAVIGLKLKTLSTEKSDAIDEAVRMEAAIMRLQSDYESQKIELDKLLEEAQLKVKVANVELEHITTEVNRKLMILKEKEESLEAKQTALRAEQTELITAKRRFESVRSLYGDA